MGIAYKGPEAAFILLLLLYNQRGESEGGEGGERSVSTGGLADDGKRLDFLSPRGPFYFSAGGSTSLNVTVIFFMLFTRGGVRGGESRSGLDSMGGLADFSQIVVLPAWELILGVFPELVNKGLTRKARTDTCRWEEVLTRKSICLLSPCWEGGDLHPA